MTEEEGLRIFSDEKIKKKIIEETAAAFLYSDAEIREILPPEEAEEFIELRNVAAESLGKNRPSGYGDDEPATPLAAEDAAEY